MNNFLKVGQILLDDYDNVGIIVGVHGEKDMINPLYDTRWGSNEYQYVHILTLIETIKCAERYRKRT